MSTIINARSPYYFKVSNADLDSVKLQLYIWTGTHSQRTSAYLRYTISKDQRLDELDRGTTTSTTANKLVDSTQNFNTTAQVGSFVKNTTQGTTASVTAIDSDTTLTLDADIMDTTGDEYILFAKPYVVFELSELIRDYLETEYNDYATDAVWVDADVTIYNSAGSIVQVNSQNTNTTTFLGIDGYGYFEDGVNPRDTSTPMVLQENTDVYYYDGQDIKIPVFAEAETITATLTSSAGADVNWEAADDFWDTYDVTWGSGQTPVTITDNGNTNQKIQYVIITDTEDLNDGDYVTFSSNNSSYPDDVVITLKKVNECKFSPLNTIFYNKYGALQGMWFFKKSTTNINVTSEQFKNNILDLENSGGTPSYALSKHQEKKFMVNGKESITMNTGFYPENHNEVVRQMLLSEQVWADDTTTVLPINLKSNSLQFKKSVNDKLITYTVQFDYAFDKINNIL
jgi:hypothetical protein